MVVPEAGWTIDTLVLGSNSVLAANGKVPERSAKMTLQSANKTTKRICYMNEY